MKKQVQKLSVLKVIRRVENNPFHSYKKWILSHNLLSAFSTLLSPNVLNIFNNLTKVKAKYLLFNPKSNKLPLYSFKLRKFFLEFFIFLSNKVKNG